MTIAAIPLVIPYFRKGYLDDVTWRKNYAVIRTNGTIKQDVSCHPKTEAAIPVTGRIELESRVIVTDLVVRVVRVNKDVYIGFSMLNILDTLNQDLRVHFREFFPGKAFVEWRPHEQADIPVYCCFCQLRKSDDQQMEIFKARCQKFSVHQIRETGVLRKTGYRGQFGCQRNLR